MVVLSFIAQYLILHPVSIDVRLPYQANLIRDYISEFNFRAQPNIAIYYTMLILDVAAFLLFLIAHFTRASKDKNKSSWTAFAWIVLFIAIDNLALVQSKIFEYFRDGTNAGGGWLKYPWMLPAFLLLLLALVFIGLWPQFDNKYRVLFLASIVLYFAGVFVKIYSKFTFAAAEQALQYGGATLLVYSLLLYMESHASLFSVSAKD
jgi:hypothetical protein